MAYDFEALENGIVTIHLRNHNNTEKPHDAQFVSMAVRKGEKYCIDWSGVDLRWR